MAHRTSKQEAIRIVDQTFDELFKGLASSLVKLSNEQRSWNGSTMNFGFTAKMGFLQNPIQGTVTVTDKDITIDADLGMLENLISQGKIKTAVQESFQKLLPGSMA